MSLRTAGSAAIRLAIQPLGSSRFLATSPDVPGLVAEGRSVTEATAIAQDLASKIAQSCLEHGDPLPLALKPPNRPAKPIELTVPVRT